MSNFDFIICESGGGNGPLRVLYGKTMGIEGAKGLADERNGTCGWI